MTAEVFADKSQYEKSQYARQHPESVLVQEHKTGKQNLPTQEEFVKLDATT